MSKRKFSPKKFYKLAKIIVIVTTILAALTSAYSIYFYNLEMPNLYEEDIAFCKEKFPESSWCIVNAGNKYRFWGELAVKSTLVVLILPLTFFGGVWLYKYLFPPDKGHFQKTKKEDISGGKSGKIGKVKYFSIGQLRRLLKEAGEPRSRRCIYYWIKKGKIQAAKQPITGHWRIPEGEVKKVMEFITP